MYIAEEEKNLSQTNPGSDEGANHDSAVDPESTQPVTAPGILVPPPPPDSAYSAPPPPPDV